MTTDHTHSPRLRPAARLRGLVLWWLLAALPSPGSPALAAGDVLVVLAERGATHDEVVSAMRASLGDAFARKLSLRTTIAKEFADAMPRTGEGRLPDLIVSVGTGAAGAVLRERLPVPVYCTFLPEAAYEDLLRAQSSRPEHAHQTALFLDQPLTLQMQLLRLALPRHIRVGVVLGPESRRNEPALQRAAAAAGRILRVERITEERQLIQAIYRVMDDADVLLAVPDPLVFNRHTAQNVLLTTYRLGKPVAGYSRAYVGAGALLAVYSTPAQIGREIGERLRALVETPGQALPPPHHPRYFSVEVNERVAHSLGLEPGQEQDLADRLARGVTEAGR